MCTSVSLRYSNRKSCLSHIIYKFHTRGRRYGRVIQLLLETIQFQSWVRVTLVIPSVHAEAKLVVKDCIVIESKMVRTMSILLLMAFVSLSTAQQQQQPPFSNDMNQWWYIALPGECQFNLRWVSTHLQFLNWKFFFFLIYLQSIICFLNTWRVFFYRSSELSGIRLTLKSQELSIGG